MSVTGNPIHEQGDLNEKVLKVRDGQLLDVIRALEARKDFRQENALNLMVLGDGEAGGWGWVDMCGCGWVGLDVII